MAVPLICKTWRYYAKKYNCELFILEDPLYDTEWMRPIGSFRFDLGAVWNVLKKPKYYGRLEYVSENNVLNIINDNLAHLFISINKKLNT